MPEEKRNQQPKLWTPVFVVIIAITLCTFVIGQGTNSGSTVYVDRLGDTATLAGMGAAVFSIAAAVARILMGPLTDSRGRLVVMAAGSAVLLAGVVGPALTATLDLFLFWRLVQGIGFAAATTAAATAAADVLPVERLGEGIGYYGLGQALAMSIGPALAITLVATEPPENLYWGLSVAGALACVLCLFCRYESHPESLPETATYRTLSAMRAEQAGQEAGQRPDQGGAEGAGQRADQGAERSDEQRAEQRAERSGGQQAGQRADQGAGQTAGQTPDQSQKNKSRFIDRIFEPGALAGGIPMMVLSPVMGFTLFYAGLLGTHLGVGNAGIFYTMSAVTMILVRLASKKFMDRVAAIKIHAVSVAAAIVTYGIFIFILNANLEAPTRDTLFYLAGIPYGLCPGLSISINQAVAVKNSSEERWGAANGLFLLLTDVGIGIASVAWGATNDLLGFQFTMCCAGAMALLSIGAAMICYPPADRVWRTRR